MYIACICGRTGGTLEDDVVAFSYKLEKVRDSIGLLPESIYLPAGELDGMRLLCENLR